MKCVDELKFAAVFGTIEETRKGIAALAGVMISDRSDFLPDDLAHQLETLLSHSLVVQGAAIDEMNSLIEEAPASAANLAEASRDESIARINTNSEDSKSNTSCQGLSTETLEGKKIWESYGNLFNASEDLEKTRSLLSDMKYQLDTIDNITVAEALKETLSESLDVIGSTYQSIRVNARGLQKLLA